MRRIMAGGVVAMAWVAGVPIAGVASAMLARGPSASPEATAMPASAGSQRRAVDSLGAQTVRTTCLACHTMQGPPKSAPPLAMVAARYRTATASPEEAVTRMVAWAKQPDAGRSLLPPMMMRRFGLMPALALPDSQLAAAARYILADTTHGHGAHMAGAGRPE